MLPNVWEFVSAVQFSFGLLCMVWGFAPVPKNKFLSLSDLEA